MSSTGTGAVPGRVYRKDGSEAVLGKRLGGGGEGTIWEVVSEPNHVVKLYRKPTEDHRRKLEAMLKAVPDDPQRAKKNHVSICWPEDIVYTATGELAGFFMPRLNTDTHRPVALFWNPEDRALFFPGFTWKYLCVAAANAASVVDLIHQKGHAVGDLNEENLLVNDRALVTMVDCDSMQVRDPESGTVFRCTVSREPYIAPEALSKDLSQIDRSYTQDYWSLAVLVFQMLLEGQHPTNGIGDPHERSERLKRGIFPFFGAQGFRIPTYAVGVELLPEGLRALFHRCFIDGHQRPEVRPTAAEWRNELQRVVSSLKQCSDVHLHWYSPHLSDCAWCEEKRSLGLDRFAIGAADMLQDELPAIQVQPAPPAYAPPSHNNTPKVSPPGKNPSLFGDMWPLFAIFGMLLLVIIGVIFNKSNATAAADRQRQEQQAREQEEARAQEARQSAELLREQKRAEAARTSPQLEGPMQSQQPASSLSTSQAPQPEVSSGSTSPPAFSQPAQALSWKRHSTSELALLYPPDWALNVRPEQVTSVHIYPPSGLRRRADGQLWFDYGVEVTYLPAINVDFDTATDKMIELLAMQYPGMRIAEQNRFRSAFGEARGTTLQHATPFNYIETQRLLTMQRGNRLLVVILAAPSTQYADYVPVFSKILDSIAFH